jgi:hypothetical protein
MGEEKEVEEEVGNRGAEYVEKNTRRKWKKIRIGHSRASMSGRGGSGRDIKEKMNIGEDMNKWQKEKQWERDRRRRKMKMKRTMDI